MQRRKSLKPLSLALLLALSPSWAATLPYGALDEPEGNKPEVKKADKKAEKKAKKEAVKREVVAMPAKAPAPAAVPAVAVAAAKPALPAVEYISGWSADRVQVLQKQTAAALGLSVVGKPCPDCLEEVVIPAGSFDMGSPETEVGRDSDEGPVHRVTIGKPFALAKTEVTLGQFARFVAESGYKTDAEENRGGNAGCRTWKDGKWDWQAGLSWKNPGFQQVGDHPVVCVSWNDANAYVAWLAKKSGKTYRLPTEAQWEYAARGGSSMARPWGDKADEACTYANVADQTAKSHVPGASSWTIHNCSDGYAYTAPVGKFAANPFGLVDMIGNAWEWTADRSHGSYAESGRPDDGSVWDSGTAVGRVLRGGSWYSLPRSARSAYRSGSEPANRSYLTGFRPARMLP